MALVIALGGPLIIIHGPGSQAVRANYQRALQLGEGLPESSLHFAALWGWWRLSDNFRDKAEWAQQLQQLAERLGEAEYRLQAHHARWATLFALGEPRACFEPIESGLRLYDAGDFLSHATVYGGHDVKVCALGEASLVCWLTGKLESARRYCRAALDFSQKIEHSASRAHALDYDLTLTFFFRDSPALCRKAQTAMAFSEQHGFSDYYARASVFWGWAIALEGDRGAGIAAIEAGIEAQRSTGTTEDFPIFFDMLAEVKAFGGEQSAASLALIDDAFARSTRNEVRVWDAELHRRKGELLSLAMSGNTEQAEQAEQCWQEALTVAERQGAEMLALRAANCLARLWQSRGDYPRAAALLKPLCERFASEAGTLDEAGNSDFAAAMTLLNADSGPSPR